VLGVSRDSQRGGVEALALHLLTVGSASGEVFFMRSAKVIAVNFRALVDRKIRERREDARTLAEHRMTKHQIQAKNSCVADARSYRVASRRSVYAHI
jgi:hypothetical protein